MNDEQEAFTAYLIHLLLPKDTKNFEDTISKLTTKLLSELYKQFKTMNETLFAKLGSKIDYISRLNGKCPEGYEVEKFMAGGCAKCKKKALLDSVTAFYAKKRISSKKDGLAFKPIVGGPAMTNSTSEMKINLKKR